MLILGNKNTKDMVKYNKSMKSFISSDRSGRETRTRQRKIELSDYCKQYLRTRKQFEWFILRYYGPAKAVELLYLAENNEEELIRNELQAIWYELPDNLFNIRNNPEGWEVFLKLVEE